MNYSKTIICDKVSASRCIMLLRVISALLLALILNVNGLRIITGINIPLSYSLFALFGISVTAIHFLEKRRKPSINIPLAIALALAAVWAATSIILKGRSGWGNLFKFYASIIVAFCATQLDTRQRVYTLRFFLTVNVFYSIYTVFSHSYISTTYLIPKIYNYLDVTLPMGLGLAVCLSLLFLGTGSLRSVALYLVVAGMQILGLFQYYARGNVLFPLLTVVILLFLIALSDCSKRLRNLTSIGVIIAVSVGLFLLFSSPKMVRRMTNLFYSLSEELRLDLFRHYWQSIASQKTLLLGIGFGQSRDILLAGGFDHYYPHNFLLELAGELGLAGVVLILTTVVEICRSVRLYLQQIRMVQSNCDLSISFLFSAAGFLFFLMTFSKSYSIFDGYQLFIFIAMLLVTGPKNSTQVSEVAIND